MVALVGILNPKLVAFNVAEVAVDVDKPPVTATVAFELSFATTLVGLVHAVPVPAVAPVTGKLGPPVPLILVHAKVVLNEPAPPAQISTPLATGACNTTVALPSAPQQPAADCALK